MNLCTILAREVLIDGLEIQLDSFPDVGHGLLSAIAFAETARKTGNVSAETPIITGLENDSELYFAGSSRDVIIAWDDGSGS